MLDLVDARDDRALLWVNDDDTAALSADQKRAVANIGRSPWLVQPLSAPAGAGKTTSMRALRAARRRAARPRCSCWRPTGKAVDVAVREGAGDTGLHHRQSAAPARATTTGPQTHAPWSSSTKPPWSAPTDLRQLLTATTRAGAKTVLVGDAHQLAPVKARGGMFAQLCADLPWTQHLSEVWRMRDPEERDRLAGAARRRHGNRLRSAVGWYRTHDRLHCRRPDRHGRRRPGRLPSRHAPPAKTPCWSATPSEMADALNQRLHDERIDRRRAHRDRRARAAHRASATSSSAAATTPPSPSTEPRRQRRVAATRCATATAGASPRSTPTRNRIAAERLDDGARAVFDGDYLREHVTLGYAVTVHSAQGVTADTTHAVLGENATAHWLYVAMTRGRHTNTASPLPAHRRGSRPPTPQPRRPLHVARRGTEAATPLASCGRRSLPTTRAPDLRSRRQGHHDREQAFRAGPRPHRPPRQSDRTPPQGLLSHASKKGRIHRELGEERTVEKAAVSRTARPNHSLDLYLAANSLSQVCQ